ncbi:MAG: Hsp70 family protein [Synergistaceae bacterium]|nr:Hsp70 family protein [Synergistaceae bacterium]
MSRNLYFGIDLGTTNSVAAWGQVKDGKFITKVVELRILDENKNPQKNVILPSCVYYKPGEPPIVGAYAKRMLKTQSRRVIKSAKSFMGTGKKFIIDDKEITPVEVSSLILKQIAVSSREFNLGVIPDDAVITVPASFDFDQRADTNEAAKLAGFKVTEDDGSPRNILLPEPAAALYDFLNRQDNGDIPEALDLSKPKIILVFDIGGGTLDISLHEVRRNENNVMPYDIRHYSISTHTLMGGDKFDALLQEFLITRLSKKIDIASLGEVRANSFMSEILDVAEYAKKDLNSMVETYRMQGRDDYENILCPVVLQNIAATDCDLAYDLRPEEYRQIMRPYLAPDLSIDSLANLDALSNRTENIIYPILDVLDKARKIIGSVPKIDAVLMNGGMSKLFAVRERIRDFFGFEPLEVGDPDLAVARGASVYHYWRHQGAKTPEIQNDDVGIALQGGTLRKLILAGTTLPFTTEVLEGFATSEDNALWLDLPFYKGSRSDTQPPNRRIAARRIRFTTPQPIDTPVNIQASVNEAGILSLKVWKPDEPDKLYSVDNVHTEIAEEVNLPEYIIPEGGFKKKIIEAQDRTGLATENIAALMNRYKQVAKVFDTAKNVDQNRNYMMTLKAIEERIMSASNCAEAIEPMKSIMESPCRVSERAARMLGKIAGVSSAKDSQRAVKYLEDQCLPERVKYNLRNASFNLSGFNKLKLNIQSKVILALSTLRRPEHERLFLEILKLRPFPVRFMTPELCYALGRVGSSPNALLAVADCVKSYEASDRIAAFWALGRIGSRERPDKCSAEYLEEVMPFVLRCVREERHGTALCNGVYALGETCDQRIPGSKVSERFAVMAGNLLEELESQPYRGSPQTQNYIKIALNMVRGAELSLEQKEHLLKLREMYSSDNSDNN